MIIYETIYYDYAIEKNRKRFINLINAAFSNFLTHEKVIKQIEEKIKNEIIRKTTREEKTIKKIVKKLTKKMFKQKKNKKTSQ